MNTLSAEKALVFPSTSLEERDPIPIDGNTAREYDTAMTIMEKKFNIKLHPNISNSRSLIFFFFPSSCSTNTLKHQNNLKIQS